MTRREALYSFIMLATVFSALAPGADLDWLLVMVVIAICATGPRT